MAEEILIPKIFIHEEFGEIRTLGDWENPKFCLVDLCRILEIGNPSDVKKRLEDGVVSIEVIPDSLGRLQKMTFVNEDGFYDVVLDSRKPVAKKFRKWVTKEVLPTLRKTGSYTMDENPHFEGNREYFPRDLSEKWLKEKTGEALIKIAKLVTEKELKMELLRESYFFLTDKELSK